VIRISVASLILLTVACGGGPKSGTTPSFLRIEDAALPYRIVRAQDGREILQASFVEVLKNSQAICVGEDHSDSHHHWAQLEILTQLGESGAERRALGMEMFQRPFQGVLDDYRESGIGEKALLSRSDWERRWGHDWRFYRPIINLAVKRGLSLLALNISKELKEKWKASGAEGLSDEDKAKIPELKLDDQEHRQWFRSLMESMSEKHGTDEGADDDTEPSADAEADAEPDFIDSIYPVQVLWDETMAETAANWVLAGEARRVLILAGNGHCHESAIVGRMKRRGVEGVVSIRPVVERGEGAVADLLATPMNDYLFVMTPSEAKSD
jgi:uncharacterized iron-regulated protein